MNRGNANGQTPAQSLEADAAKMMKELDGLVGKIKDLGKQKPDEIKDAAVNALNEQMKALQDKLGALTKEHQETLDKIDKSVRANPYLFILGALGLGLLVGKAMRS